MEPGRPLATGQYPSEDPTAHTAVRVTHLANRVPAPPAAVDGAVLVGAADGVYAVREPERPDA